MMGRRSTSAGLNGRVRRGWVDAKSGVREVRGRGVSPVLGFGTQFLGSNMQSKKTEGENGSFFSKTVLCF